MGLNKQPANALQKMKILIFIKLCIHNINNKNN